MLFDIQDATQALTCRETARTGARLPPKRLAGNRPSCCSKGSLETSAQSQPLSQRYRSVLPTSLDYYALLTRGIKPRRPDADMSTFEVSSQTLNSTFQGWLGALRTLRKVECSDNRRPYRRLMRFHGERLSRRKEISPQGPQPHRRNSLCHHAIFTRRLGDQNPTTTHSWRKPPFFERRTLRNSSPMSKCGSHGILTLFSPQACD